MFIFDLDVSEWLVLAVMVIVILLVVVASLAMDVRRVRTSKDEWVEFGNRSREEVYEMRDVLHDLGWYEDENGEWCNGNYEDDDYVEFSEDTEEEVYE